MIELRYSGKKSKLHDSRRKVGDVVSKGHSGVLRLDAQAEIDGRGGQVRRKWKVANQEGSIDEVERDGRRKGTGDRNSEGSGWNPATPAAAGSCASSPPRDSRRADTAPFHCWKRCR